MRRALITGIASLLAVALLAPAAQAATQVREVHYEWPVPTAGVPGTPSEGAITLDFIFKNTRSNKKRFTPRLLTRIAFDKIYLTCTGTYMTFTRQFFLTETLETKIEAEEDPDSASKARPLRLPNRPLQVFQLQRHDLGRRSGQPHTRAQTKAGVVLG